MLQSAINVGVLTSIMAQKVDLIDRKKNRIQAKECNASRLNQRLTIRGSWMDGQKSKERSGTILYTIKAAHPVAPRRA